jgi:hypothetical protein
MAYLQWTTKYGGMKFEDIPILDPKFREWRNIAQRETNPLAQYIESDNCIRDDLLKNERYWIPLETFQSSYRTTMRMTRGMKDPKFSETVYKGVFPTYGISIVVRTDGTKWLKGICTRELKDTVRYKYIPGDEKLDVADTDKRTPQMYQTKNASSATSSSTAGVGTGSSAAPIIVS